MDLTGRSESDIIRVRQAKKESEREREGGQRERGGRERGGTVTEGVSGGLTPCRQPGPSSR